MESWFKSAKPPENQHKIEREGKLPTHLMKPGLVVSPKPDEDTKVLSKKYAN